MRSLLDINVLIALTWPNHPHHGRTRSWFGREDDRRWASTPATEMSFVRLSCNPVVVSARATAAEAAELLTALRARADHEFWPDAVDAASVDWFTTSSFRQVPDTHLMAVARAHRGMVATLDRGLADRFGSSQAVELIGPVV